jgi:hypothetical protein
MSIENSKQIGGTHYQQDYQPWDFITDNNIPYLLGNAIKYVVRYRDKNGVQDLEKAIHYLDKSIERGLVLQPVDKELLTKFGHQYSLSTSQIIYKIARGAYQDAIEDIRIVIGAIHAIEIRAIKNSSN